MGSVGSDFESYLRQNENELTDAERDMLAAGDLDRLSGREHQYMSPGVEPATSSTLRSIESDINRIKTVEQVPVVRERIQKQLTNPGNYREDLNDLLDKLNRLDTELRK